jgi:hypothetical protein
MLFIQLEMLKGQSKLVAEFKTTNNLNGTFPITTPQEAEIKVREIKAAGVDYDNEITFQYDEDLGSYVSDMEANNKFLSHGTRYELSARIENSNFDAISSITTVPYPIQIEKSELLHEEVYTDIEGNSFWQGTLGITFLPVRDIIENFGHLQIYGRQTLKTLTSSGEPQYQFIGDEQFFELVNVMTGNSAITDILQRDGFLIEFDELQDNYIEIVLRSPFPIIGTNQVTDFIHCNLFSVSKEHFNYHKALHNIKRSQNHIFEENVLFSSNIEKGLGLFSSCVESKVMISLR